MLFQIGEPVFYTHLCSDFGIGLKPMQGVLVIEDSSKFHQYQGKLCLTYQVDGWWIPEQFLAPVTLRAGDTVRIVKVVEHEKGWTNTWCHTGMTPCVGKKTLHKVVGHTKHGVILHGSHYNWPRGSLQFIHSGVPAEENPNKPVVEAKPIIYLD